MNSFRLVKWYLDCVSDRGDFVVGYSALLQLGLLKFPLAARLTRVDGKIESNTTLSRQRFEPKPESGSITWNCPKLNVQGSWKPLAAPVKRVLFEDSSGGVVWDCLQPISEAVVTRRGNLEIRGLGYVERMEMTVAPWKLGLRTLLWGRFVSRSDSVIWISWDGDREYSLILHNGMEAPRGKMEPDNISLEQDCRLILEESQVIRQGKVNNTALSSIPLVRTVLPKWLRSINEQKWLSRGQLKRADGTSSDGWVIHERVSFER